MHRFSRSLVGWLTHAHTPSFCLGTSHLLPGLPSPMRTEQASLVFSQEQSNILQDRNPTHIMHSRCEPPAPLVSHMKAEDLPHLSQKKPHPSAWPDSPTQPPPSQLDALRKEILIPLLPPGSTLCYSRAREEFPESPILGIVISLSKERLVQESTSKTNEERRWRQPNPISPKESR